MDLEDVSVKPLIENPNSDTFLKLYGDKSTLLIKEYLVSVRKIGYIFLIFVFFVLLIFTVYFFLFREFYLIFLGILLGAVSLCVWILFYRGLGLKKKNISIFSKTKDKYLFLRWVNDNEKTAVEGCLNDIVAIQAVMRVLSPATVGYSPVVEINVVLDSQERVNIFCSKKAEYALDKGMLIADTLGIDFIHTHFNG